MRALNAGGRENDGHPSVAPTAVLQDKARCYFVRDTLALSRGQVYGPGERKRGLVVLNVLGQRRLSHLPGLPRPSVPS